MEKIKSFFSIIKCGFLKLLNQLKTFFLMTKYESLRLIRNKVVIFLFVLFPIILLIILGAFANNATYKVAINRNNIDMNELNVVELIKKSINIENIIDVESDDVGKECLVKGEAVFFISLKKSSNEVIATIYYDNSTTLGRNIKTSLTNVKNQYAYNTLKNVLKEYGVTIDERYFNLISFKEINKNKVPWSGNVFVFEFTTFISVIIMFGLAFSISRDNETGISKQIAYTPTGYNKYILSKFFPYLVLGLVQSLIMLLIGNWLFEIKYIHLIFMYIPFIFLFLISLLSLGTLICLLKNQIVVAILSAGSIILPLFALAFGFISSYPISARIVLLMLPPTSFIELFRNYIFNDIILYQYIFIMIITSIVYYSLTIFLLKRKSYQNR